MFTRTTKVRKIDRTYEYLKLVENIRKKGKTEQKVVANFGNVETLNVKKIDSAIASLLKFSSGFFKDIRKLKSENTQHLGEIIAGEKIWNELELTELLEKLIPDSHVGGNVPLIVKTMVLSRLVEPLSKLALSKFYPRLAIPGLDDQALEPHHFYRAMDELIPHKDAVEIALHEREKDLFSLKLNMVFYDLTSSYFEGEQCPVGKKGYSRDHRPDLKQIAIGLLVTDEGLPIAHHVYSGNTSDSTTLPDQIDALKGRFGVKKCVLVVDRGMVTEKNLTALRSAGFQYIVALRKRRQSLFAPILDEIRAQLVPIKGQDDLSGYETKIEKFGDDRVIICYNPKKAVVEARHRKERLEKAQARLAEIQELFVTGKRKDAEKLLQQAARYLERKKQARFFSLRMDAEQGIAFEVQEAKIDFEAQLDGLFILRTNRRDLTMAEVVAAYKTLNRAENAFRELKDFIDLRPMYHWSSDRVRGHIFICVLAYLVEICIELKLRRAGHKLTARAALDHLSEIELIHQEVENIKLCTYTQPSKLSREIIRTLGLHLPKKKLFKK